MYQIGTTLRTKDGRKIGNAIVTGLTHCDDHTFYDIETDFGNKVMLLTIDELRSYFYAPKSPTDIGRWYSDRDAIRSRSSMAEQPTVDRQDVGSVPTVTATLSHPTGCHIQGRNKTPGQCDSDRCNYPFCE